MGGSTSLIASPTLPELHKNMLTIQVMAKMGLHSTVLLYNINTHIYTGTST